MTLLVSELAYAKIGRLAGVREMGIDGVLLSLVPLDLSPSSLLKA